LNSELVISCPSCGFRKTVPADKVPKLPISVSCSKCSASFLLTEESAAAAAASPQAEVPPAQTGAGKACPKCGYVRTDADDVVDPDTCPKCHVVYAKLSQRRDDVTYDLPIPLEMLAYPREKTLFNILFLVSIIYWLVLLLATKGGILAFVAFFVLLQIFAQSALLSHLKGNGVQLSSTQFPELYERHLACCRKLRLAECPDAYLINGSGILNAFASRFLGRNFIVLYSNVIEAMADQPDAINFYIGHELGHIKRNHLVWGPFLGPATFFPLIGPAYSRAREYTCDQYGRACCETPESAVRGLIALSAGEKLWRGVNLQAYMRQTEHTQGFWMSLHELVADYPWIVKRASRVNNPFDPLPRRNPLAWFFALFIPRFGVGGSPATILVTVAIIGILAAIAVPQFQQYQEKAKSHNEQVEFQGK